MLLSGPVSRTSKQYMDFVKIFNVLPDVSFSLIVLMGVEVLLCLADY